MTAANRHPIWLLVHGAICLITLSLNSDALAEGNEVAVFRSGVDGYHTYRIPAIVRAKNGDLLAFAEGRKNAAADHGDIDIVLKRSSDGGQTWSPMQLVQDEWEEPTTKIWIGNPTPIVDLGDPQHPGRIWLVFTRNNQRMFVSSSDDNGQTWSARRDITATAGKPEWDWYAAGPLHGIQLSRGPHAGRLIAPCDHSTGQKSGWGAHLIYSDDHGVTWKLGAADTHDIADPLHPNESVVVELEDGRIYDNARDQEGSDPATRAIAFSSDGGEHFDHPFAAEPAITTPVVQNSLIRFAAKNKGDSENMLIYCGPGDAKQRRDLTLLVSGDEAKTWGRKMVIHPGPAAYSDLVKLDGGKVGVLYEAGKKLYGEIVFQVVKIDDLSPAAK